MKICFLTWRIIFTELIFILTDAIWYTILKLESGSAISIFSLWNFTGAHCNKPGLFYRNNYIDNITNECIWDFNLMFVMSDSDKFQIKYRRLFSDFYLGHILSEVPNYVADWLVGSGGTPPSNNHILISTDSYEYLWINNAETMMYAGAYYNKTDPYSPKFVFSYGGVAYARGMNSSQLVSDRPVKYLEVIVNIQAPCEHLFSEPVDDSLCLGRGQTLDGSKQGTLFNITNLGVHEHNPTTVEQICDTGSGPDVKITGNTTEVAKGTQANLTCTISSQLPILGVTWTRDGAVLSVEQNPTKYQGVINGTHTLLINNFQLNDSGVHECTAVTAMGTGRSLSIDVQMIKVLQCSWKAERVLQNDQPWTTKFEEHINCHSLQLLNTFTTASSIGCGLQCLRTNDCTGFRVVKNKGECEIFSVEAGSTTFPSVYIMRN